MRIWKKKKQLARLGAVGVALLTAGAVPAQEESEGYSLKEAPFHIPLSLTCRFATECHGIEACTGSDLSLMLEGDAGGLDEDAMVVSVVLSPGEGDDGTEIVGVRDKGAMSLSGGRFEARHLLTVAADGAARYTVHYVEGPEMVSYAGRCE